MFPENTNEKIQVIADSVIRLSDFYIENPDAETPWSEKYCQIAYRHYYLPLNYLRVQHIVDRGQKVGFFKGLRNFIDWGAGPGTASLALIANAELNSQIEKQYLYDISESVLKNFNDLHENLKGLSKSTNLDLRRIPSPQQSALVFSYSLTEVSELPAGWNEFEALMILEPATGKDGRKLLELRTKLIENGYSIWAPCTHQLACPLLTQSKHDWCHDRAHVKAPVWFNQVEQLLPMKNKTVTTSYLLARRLKPPEFLKNLGRLTGDSLEEKGKTRQLICKNERREYLTWMNKTIKAQTLPRGELVCLPENFELKSNEIRLSEPIQTY